MTAGVEFTKTAIGHGRCPPLRVHHILACTAVSAAALYLYQLPQDIESLLSFGLAFVLVGSAGITFVFFACMWAFRSEWRRSPGQGFLILAALFFTLSVTGRYIYIAEFDSVVISVAGKSFSLALLWNRLKIGLLALSCIVCGFTLADTLRWRVVFLVHGSFYLALCALGVGYDYFGYEGNITGPRDVPFALSEVWRQFSFVATCIAILYATYRDSRLRVSRDWTHWTGIVGLALVHFPSLPAALRQLIVTIERTGLG